MSNHSFCFDNHNFIGIMVLYSGPRCANSNGFIEINYGVIYIGIQCWLHSTCTITYSSILMRKHAWISTHASRHRRPPGGWNSGRRDNFTSKMGHTTSGASPTIHKSFLTNIQNQVYKSFITDFICSPPKNGPHDTTGVLAKVVVNCFFIYYSVLRSWKLVW